MAKMRESAFANTNQQRTIKKMAKEFPSVSVEVESVSKHYRKISGFIPKKETITKIEKRSPGVSRPSP